MFNEVTSTILRDLENVIGKRENFTPLHEPSFLGNEWKYVKDCIDTGWVSSVGSYVDKFEKDLQDFTGVKHAVAVVNGTAGLHVGLVVLGVKADDEVLIPSLTFVATANAVRYCNAIPHFIDSEMETMGIDPEKLNDYLKEIAIIKNDTCINKITGRKIKALIPMHTFGHPVKITKLLEICKKYNIKMLEDAAESLGSYFEGIHTGNFGEVAVVSFNGNKVVTTGGGGAVLTNNTELAKRLVHITKTSKVAHPWDFIHDEVGFNYRLPNINAALGCAQLEMLPRFLESKRKLAASYEKEFEKNQHVTFFKEMKNTKSNYWLNALLLINDSVELRNEVLKTTNENKIMTRPIWKLVSTLQPFINFPQMPDLSGAQLLERKVINIPSSPNLDIAND